MKPIFQLLSAESKPDEAPLAEKAGTPSDLKAEAAPVKKRGIFMSSKFLGGKDAEPASPASGGGPDAVEAVEPKSSLEIPPAPTLEAVMPESDTPSEKSAAAPPPPTAGLILPKTDAAAPATVAAPAGTLGLPPATSDTLAGALASRTDHTAPVPPPVDDSLRPLAASSTSFAQTPGDGRASAQLTLSFEVSSLQLSPFFKLAAMRLKALSNVVSLHLVNPEKSNDPLAAGISFQIEHAEVDDASRLRSLRLKPLQDTRKLAIPLSKVQVEHLLLGGEEGNPISMTTRPDSSTVVHLFGTFVVAGMEFTPAFEIGALRLEATSDAAFVSVNSAFHPAADTPPASFSLTEVQLDAQHQIVGARVVAAPVKSA